jgi:hypothetical protein
MMKLVTTAERIKTVAARWKDAYPGSRWGADKLAISAALDALDPLTATAEDVAAIIGNTSWTDLNDCDDCGAKGAAVIQVGEEPHYESYTAYLCPACVRKAYKLCKGL